MTTLLYCPHCGHSGVAAIEDEISERWKIYCGGCGSSSGSCETIQDAKALWNARPQDERILWQPIETAPRDGTYILGWDRLFGFRETYWDLYGDGSPAKASYLSGYGPNGKWSWLEPQSNWSGSWKPTHWMPSPALPDV